MSPLRQRVHNLRRRLIAGAVALFVVLFGGITVQLASGHDPALSSTSKKAGVTQKSTPATSTSTSTTTTQQKASPTTLDPVTTSQS
jgi:ABC-type transport system substrate-binding protein